MLKKLLAAAVVAAAMTAAHAEVKTIKDSRREVKVDVPAKRIMLGFYYTDYLAVGGEKALDNVVGFPRRYGRTGPLPVGKSIARLCRN